MTLEQRCAEFLEYFPDAGSCQQAAALHHWGEVVEYRVAVGVVGAFVLGAYLLWRRRPDRQDPRYLGILPDGFSATVATSLYGVAAAALALLSLDSNVRYIVTAGVLLIAVTIDSLSRRSRQAHGRA